MKVTILQHRLMHYRVGFFESLKNNCESVGVSIDLVVGQATNRESTKKDEGKLDWVTKIHNSYIELKHIDLLWQWLPCKVFKSDLIVMMQENRILSNYLVLLLKPFFGYKTAFWGHGANFQSKNPKGLKETFKKFFINRVDYWFAYTELTCQILKDNGFSEDSISCLNNAIDNEHFEKLISSVTDEDVLNFKREKNISNDDEVALFCGSIYEEKRIDFLLKSCEVIRNKKKNFFLIVVGDGPDAGKVKEFAETNKWVIFMGAQRGKEKAIAFKSSDIILNPGLVGLHILDSFIAGKPMITLASSLHSPELSYLESGFNGLIIDGDYIEYADSCIKILSDKGSLQMMKNNALLSAKKYTLGNMVNNFLNGILRLKAD